MVTAIETNRPELAAAIDATRKTHSEGRAAYVAYMAIRMIEMARVLKSDGSIYIHCDHDANAYLRMAMDAIFGADNYRTEIIWQRTSAHNDSRSFGNVPDHILFYAKRDINQDAVRVPLSEEYVNTCYRYADNRGKYQIGDLTAAGIRDGESGQAWQGANPTQQRRHWAVPSGREPALLTDANVTTRSPFDLPVRTDEDPAPAPEIAPLPERVFKVPSSLIPEGEMLTQLPELSDYKAWRCGYANRMPDGSIIRTTRNFHLDHIDPRSRDGSNDIQNRAPLCPYHNIRKRNRRIHLDDYRKEISDSGEMMVNSANELINLAYAQHEAMLIYGRHFLPAIRQKITQRRPLLCT